MAGYRADAQTRCTGCHTAVAREDLFLTADGGALCAACKLRWADAELARSKEAWTTGMASVDGYRLHCPTCALATMRVKRGEMRFEAVCSRCGESTSRLQPASFLLGAVILMGSLLVLVPAAPLVVVGLVALYAVIVDRDLWRRRRSPVASFEQIEQAERAEREERVRVAAAELARVGDVAAESAAAELADSQEEVSDDAAIESRASR